MPGHRRESVLAFAIPRGASTRKEHGAAFYRMEISLELKKRAVLFGARRALRAGDRVVCSLGLACSLVRRGLAWPMSDDDIAWVLIGIWIQDGIERPEVETQAEKRQRRRQLRAEHPPFRLLERTNA